MVLFSKSSVLSLGAEIAELSVKNVTNLPLNKFYNPVPRILNFSALYICDTLWAIVPINKNNWCTSVAVAVIFIFI